ELKALPDVSPAGTRRIAVATERPPNALTLLKRQPFALDATLVEAEIHLLLPAETPDAAVIDALRSGGPAHAAIRPIEPSLEDVFVTLTRKLAHQLKPRWMDSSVLRSRNCSTSAAIPRRWCSPSSSRSSSSRSWASPLISTCATSPPPSWTSTGRG